jgi:hypothetical protein
VVPHEGSSKEILIRADLRLCQHGSPPSKGMAAADCFLRSPRRLEYISVPVLSDSGAFSFGLNSSSKSVKSRDLLKSNLKDGIGQKRLLF